MDKLEERVASMEVKVDMLSRSVENSFSEIKGRLQSIDERLENEVAHLEERLGRLELENTKRKTISDLLNNWVKPITISIIVVILTLIIERGISLG
ncbi:MAG: hypothetical protein DRI61_07330 [Chloroflexi bacterium]|nr:MAG: hypothetical protein DRI61_07330 [Chloroflexota bacterium]